MQVCCKFDSKSVELSDEESYTKERCKEATQEIGVLVSGSYGLIEASGSTSYSKREKFKEFKSTTAKIKRLLTVLFEATAICTKFDVRLVSNVDPTVKALFNYGQMSSLSMAEEKTKQIALKSTCVTDPEEQTGMCMGNVGELVKKFQLWTHSQLPYCFRCM